MNLLLLLLGCGTSAPTAPSGPPNLLLVSMDTVRYDHTSLGGKRDTTPNLAKLAKLGTTWTRAYSVGNESLYSHAALLTGRYPSEIALPDYGSYGVPATAQTIGKVLQAYGYSTGAFTGGGHIVADFGFDQGFQVFEAASGATRFGSFFDSVPRAERWIAAQSGHPWFAFVHGYDAHSPYVQRGPFHHPWGTTGATDLVEALAADPLAVEQLRGNLFFPDRKPADFVHAAGRTVLGTDFYTLPAEPGPDERVVKLSDAEVAHLRDHYDSGLLYGDFWLGELLAHVDLTTTLVVVVADHGEDLLDHGYMNHRTGLFDSCTHVPLVAWGPGFEGGGAVDGLVDARDVAHTILSVAGATPPAGSAGRDLREVRTGASPVEAVFAEGVMDMITVRTATHRLVYKEASLLEKDYVATLAATPPDSPHFELYDLTTDPREQTDVHLADPATTTTLRDALVAWRKSIRVGTNAIAPDQVSPEVLADLRKVARNELPWEDAVTRATGLGVRYVVVHPHVAIEATFRTSVRALKDHATLLAEDDERKVWALY